ncbi:PstS ABC-type phosphate transport system, periplasmic component [actinobacterium SCGC AAA044-D11]
MKLSKSLKALSAAVAVAILAAPSAVAAVSLTGAGATFPGPLIEACKAGYNSATGNTFTYGLGGSGAGRTASDKETSIVNFSDTPHTAARESVIHIPVTAGPIAVMYKIGNDKPLYLSPATIAGIFGGTITKWNDPKIVADNNRSVKETIFKTDGNGKDIKDKSGKPIVLREVSRKIRYTLPNKPIKVIYRSDSSGTNGNFTAALNGIAPDVWTKAGNNSFTTTFPGNINDVANLGRIVGASGSSAVTALAAKTPYSITYAESSYAKANGLAIANVKNGAGNWQSPTSSGVSAFLGAASVSPKGIVTYNYKTTDPGAYVFGAISYALIDTKQKDAETAKAVKDLLTYLLDPKCPNTKPELEYTTITGKFRDIDLALIAKISS